MTTLLDKKLIVLLGLIFSSALSVANDSTPEQVTGELHRSLVESMKSGSELSYQQRYKNLEAVVMKSFDFKTIGRIVLGRYWKKLSETQKSEFIDVFSQLSIATYTAQFKSYSGESFEFLTDKSMKRGRVLVKTQLVTNERVVSFNYILHPAEDDWRIINVIADGISDLSLKKSDYASIMKNEGFDVLVRKLLDKIDNSSNKP